MFYGEKMRWSLVVIAIVLVIVGYSYVTVANGPIEPMGRLAFVKLMNPDMYPGHPHSVLLSKEAEAQGSKCALVLQLYGGSNYRSYQDGNVYIIEVAFIDTQGRGSINMSQVNFLDSLKIALFGVPDDRYWYMSDGHVYKSYDEMMAHVNELAAEHGQQGPLPMFFKGTVREGNPVITPGEGFPLYFQILTKTYGIIPAYIYTFTGLLAPYYMDPYRVFELRNASELQYLYNQGMLNIDYKTGNSTAMDYISDMYVNNSKNPGSA